jgi:DGQHR domain-containing protein
MARKPTKQAGAKTGKLAEKLNVKAVRLKQGDTDMYLLTLPASALWNMVSINRRLEDEDRGYQRVLSNSRVAAVAEHIVEGKTIPTSVVIALDKAVYSEANGTLEIPAGKDVGWVIDGQHRIAGAFEASSKLDIQLPIVALVGVPLEYQIEQFVTINREAKGVPTSLVYDLLSRLPGSKSATQISQERAADIANTLRKDINSSFYNRIVVVNSPRKGQISITNFVRKVVPFVHPERGLFKINSLEEQVHIFDNYFSAIKSVFKDHWDSPDNVFFRTIGFGAMMNVLDDIFQITVAEYGGFSVSDIKKTLSGTKNFNFEQWSAYGSGSKAEIAAAKDFRTDFTRSRSKKSGSGLRLK